MRLLFGLLTRRLGPASLVLGIPSGGIGFLTPNDVKVLVAKSDDDARATLEFTSQ